jgi:thiamine kinase-like enzyme
MSKLPENLRDLKEIRVNQRFATYRATLEETGEDVFVKQVLHPELGDRLRREIYGLEKIAQLALTYSFPFTAPKIIQNGQDYLVTGWAKGDIMEFSPNLPDLSERIGFMAIGFATMDTATQLVHPGQTNFVRPNRKGQRPVQHIEASLGELDTDSYFDPALISRSIQYLKEHAPALTARFTHADFTPSNVMEDGENRTLIDWESASELWPRFYDLVNFTHNKSLDQPELTASLKELIDRYFEAIESSPEQNIEQLNTIAATRALSSIGEYMSEPDEFHNTETTMSAKSAAHIAATLERILTGKLYI